MSDFPSIPGYTIERLLGRGGMGSVYLARQDSLNRKVALKVTLATLGELDETFAQRFVKEARTTASLRHPNVITVYESGEVDGRCYLSMEYVPGGTLTQLLEQRRLSVDEVIDLGKGVCAGLAHAHRAGFVHRDIKPDNILLDADGAPVITDFGIVKTIHGSTQLTGTNATVGSPKYMSPEQLLGDENIDGRADLYSLGVVLFEMMEGRPPFEDDHDYAVGMKHLSERPPPLSPLNYRFQRIVGRLLQKNPDARFARAEEVSRALESVRTYTGPAFSERRSAPATPARPAPPAATPVPRASLMRRLESRFRPGRWLLWLLVIAVVLGAAMTLRGVELRSLHYELRGLLGGPMDRFLVGQALFEGSQVERGRFWMNQAMEAGYPGAAYELGRSYRYQDEGRAVRFLRIEARRPLDAEPARNASRLLGYLLCNGSAPEDCRDAIGHLRRLVRETGDAAAMLRIGEIYAWRLDPPNYEAAMDWLERAASSDGVAAGPAMVQIARLLDEGLGVDRDRRAATAWTVRAALRPGAADSLLEDARDRCRDAALRDPACEDL